MNEMNDVGDAGEVKVRHPAPYSPTVLAAIEAALDDFTVGPVDLYDPFAGIGRIFDLELHMPRVKCWGTEIEQEWCVSGHPRHIHADAFEFMRHISNIGAFDVVATSPTYGNRMADHHNAQDGSRRITYRHYLGRALHENNSGRMQWGKKYRDFHYAAWDAVFSVLKPGGLFMLNISDHYRAWSVAPVTAWHREQCEKLGFDLVSARKIQTPRMKFGDNRHRVGYEWLLVFEKPTDAAGDR